MLELRWKQPMLELRWKQPMLELRWNIQRHGQVLLSRD